jgi:ribonuclease HI
MKQIEIFSDGGSRGNPGHAGVGVLIREKDNQINSKSDNRVEISKYIGIATNNQAEYRAVIEGLRWLTTNKQQLTTDTQIDFYLDSQLVVEQLKGNYRLKNEGLKPLFTEVQELISKINGNISFTHILRDKNTIADKLVNKAIDNKLNS